MKPGPREQSHSGLHPRLGTRRGGERQRGREGGTPAEFYKMHHMRYIIIQCGREARSKRARVSPLLRGGEKGGGNPLWGSRRARWTARRAFAHSDHVDSPLSSLPPVLSSSGPEKGRGGEAAVLFSPGSSGRGRARNAREREREISSHVARRLRVCT